MEQRITTPFTNEHFAAFCLSMVGQPYWYGTCLYKCTESLRSSKSNQYPSHYGSSRTARYKEDIAARKVCADCIGCLLYTSSNKPALLREAQRARTAW